METQKPFSDRLCDVFEAERDILLAEIKKAGGEFTHGSLKGTSGEQIAKNFLRRYTPQHIDLLTDRLLILKGIYLKKWM